MFTSEKTCENIGSDIGGGDVRDLIEKVNEFREEVYNRSRNDAARDSIMQLTDFIKEIAQRLSEVEDSEREA